ncbi:hypothetical protein AAP_06302 [Ascosphaera apis ARSEF 7405]|uniref:Uncharacterized protein n=1 Tax=Ascosphaera apis ARSEF 7405 TaxID=392613 RepID=A0A167UX25_9EURO|nr:hypothetical protein AAP_06302 [Ascosphaera apis ARSEF 7405]
MADQISAYYAERVVFWLYVPPQVLAAVQLITDHEIHGPAMREPVVRSPAQRTTRRLSKSSQPWPPLWGTGNRSDINRDITKFYGATSFLRELPEYREVFDRLVLEGGFLKPPLGPRKLYMEAPYVNMTQGESTVATEGHADLDILALPTSTTPPWEVEQTSATWQVTTSGTSSDAEDDSHPPVGDGGGSLRSETQDVSIPESLPDVHTPAKRQASVHTSSEETHRWKAGAHKTLPT